MATQSIELNIAAAGPLPTAFGGTLPQYSNLGASAQTAWLAFDGTDDANETCQWSVGRIHNYGSGNVSAEITWLADTATTGIVVWGGFLAAVTPDTDATDVSAKAWDTETTVSSTKLGSEAHRLQTEVIDMSDVDSIANGDFVLFRLRRNTTTGNGDTLSGDAGPVSVTLKYSDT